MFCRLNVKHLINPAHLLLDLVVFPLVKLEQTVCKPKYFSFTKMRPISSSWCNKDLEKRVAFKLSLSASAPWSRWSTWSAAKLHTRAHSGNEVCQLTRYVNFLVYLRAVGVTHPHRDRGDSNKFIIHSGAHSILSSQVLRTARKYIKKCTKSAAWCTFVAQGTCVCSFAAHEKLHRDHGAGTQRWNQS